MLRVYFVYEWTLIALHSIFEVYFLLIANNYLWSPLRLTVTASSERYLFNLVILMSMLSLVLGAVLLGLRRYKFAAVMVGIAGLVTLPTGLISVGVAHSLWRYPYTLTTMTGKQAAILTSAALVGTVYFVALG